MRLPLQSGTVKRLSKRLMWIARPLSKGFPLLDSHLKKIGEDVKGDEYIAIVLLFALNMASLIAITLSFLFGLIFSLRGPQPTYSLPEVLLNGIFPGFLTGLGVFIMIFLYWATHPKLLVNRKTRSIESNLLYALKYIAVQLHAGIPLFDAILSVAEEEYGEISVEFKKLKKQVTTGTPMEFVFDKLASESPSQVFNMTLLQLSNSLKTGVAISSTINSLINSLSKEQKIAIRKYGAQLNPLTMMYMMIAVIIPALGVTLLIALSSIAGSTVNESIFWIILISVILFQFMYVKLIGSRRPNI